LFALLDLAFFKTFDNAYCVRHATLTDKMDQLELGDWACNWSRRHRRTLWLYQVRPRNV